jgi:xanthine dehydrogenase accessory factor
MAILSTVVSNIASHVPAVSSFGGMRGFIDIATRLAEQSVDAVVAIVVDDSGTATRNPGTMSLFDKDGHRAGSLSGGTVEQFLVQEARSVLSDGRARLVRFDSVNDSSHCAPGTNEASGLLRILILPLPARAAPLRDAIVRACSSSAWLRLRLELGDDAGQQLPGAGEARIGSDVFSFDSSGEAIDDPHDFVRHVSLSFAPPPRIALLGGGPESAAFVRQAHLLGWYAELVDARPDVLAIAGGQRVDRVHASRPDALPILLSERHFDAAIIGGHDFEVDLAHLRQLGASGIGYIGLLGPPERRDALLARVGDIIATQLEPRLYAPAGLRLGGQGPEVAALAIVAQLQYYLAHDAYA